MALLVSEETEATSGAVPSGPAESMSAAPSVREIPLGALSGLGSAFVAAVKRARLLSVTTAVDASACVKRGHEARTSVGRERAPMPRASAAARVAPETQYAFR